MNNIYERPLVSVVIPFFNCGTFMDETIRTVLAQTFNNWELLLVDDGSTDNSAEIALNYSKQFPNKIHYLEHDGHMNLGTSATRNLGIKRAKGKYIALLDADDLWVPNKLDQQVEILELIPEAGMVYGGTKFWFSWNDKPPRPDHYFLFGVKTNSLIYRPTLLVLALKDKIATASMSNVMIRHEVLEKTGLFEDNFPGMYDDQVFLAKIILNSAVFVSNRYWDIYRQHPTSLHWTSLKNDQKLRADKLEYLHWLESYLEKINYDNPELSEAIEHSERDARSSKPASTVQTYYSNLRKILQIPIQYVSRNLIMFIFRHTVPENIRREVLAYLKGPSYVASFDRIRFGDLRSLTPINEIREKRHVLTMEEQYINKTLDRYYIDNFLISNSDSIKGNVLEISDDYYTLKLGGQKVEYGNTLNYTDLTRVIHDYGASDVQNIKDLSTQITVDHYDCIIFTQTLQLIYDIHSVVRVLHDMLKPGGVLLATFTGISQIQDKPKDKYWCWNLTSASAEQLFSEFFPIANIQIKGYGNILVAIGLLHGIFSGELDTKELEYYDSRYEIIITVKAVKPESVE